MLASSCRLDPWLHEDHVLELIQVLAKHTIGYLNIFNFKDLYLYYNRFCILCFYPTRSIQWTRIQEFRFWHRICHLFSGFGNPSVLIFRKNYFEDFWIRLAVLLSSQSSALWIGSFLWFDNWTLKIKFKTLQIWFCSFEPSLVVGIKNIPSRDNRNVKITTITRTFFIIMTISICLYVVDVLVRSLEWNEVGGKSSVIK